MFIDGHTEFLGVIKTKEKLPTINSTGNVTINLSMRMSTDASLTVEFSNKDVFVTSVGTTPSSPGEYQIIRSETAPQVIVNIGTIPSDTGYISYYYVNPNVSPTGWYSINYKTGEVFTYSTTTSGITVDYRYVDYRVRYSIARKVNDFLLEGDKTIILQDKELVNKLTIQRINSNTQYYQVLYNYVSEFIDDNTKLIDYFTPVLLDYVLKVIPEGKLLNG
jgi:hypothetical protein